MTNKAAHNKIIDKLPMMFTFYIMTVLQHVMFELNKLSCGVIFLLDGKKTSVIRKASTFYSKHTMKIRITNSQFFSTKWLSQNSDSK